ncbi:MAG: DNA-3-methyladenine glycosylase 2 family protein [Deltaproteobacteria bacterium]|nr:DNA-3-methyladenine glycosylase 2 family protein [Deltaproteobacteria bacterium]
MDLDPQHCYRAVLARDARFDGRFFSGVVTTGIYCRPICPVHPPKFENIRWYACAAAAEAAGFRPCRRCRPETAPGTPAWMGSAAVVSRALRLITAGAFEEDDVEGLATRLGLGARQLRRVFAQHLGASPAQVARSRRIHFARRLLDDTQLSMTRIAFNAGFRSVRQFNHAMRQCFGAAPSELRRRTKRPQTAGSALVVRLPFRPPLDWAAVLGFLAARATPGIEHVEGNCYRRSIALNDARGIIEVAPVPEQRYLRMSVDLSCDTDLFQAVERARRLFDLDADPSRIDEQLQRSSILKPLVDATPGLRVPGTWDGFELAVRAVLGQQVSVRGATTLAGRLVQAFGQALQEPRETITHLFPTPESLTAADLTTIGLPRARATTIRDLAIEVAAGRLQLDSALGLDEAVGRLRAVRGIGEWTAQYIAMRALGEPDAFPAGDLGLRRALANGAGPLSSKQIAEIAESWRPWRSYATMRLWTHLSQNEVKR